MNKTAFSVAGQTIRKFSVKRLVLWTENPRDPLPTGGEATNTNFLIAKRAVSDEKRKWRLRELAREMGAFYDYSELPTVVMAGKHPIVYDGNRRIILAKLKKCYAPTIPVRFALPDVEDTIPCCVCSHEMAIEKVWRKHSSNGTWDHIERDMFDYKFRGNPPSLFLQLDQLFGGIISTTPTLNQLHVKEEVFTPENLDKIGFQVRDGQLFSKHTEEEARRILDAIVEIIGVTQTTRKGRGELLAPISERVGDIITRNQNQEYHIINMAAPNVPLRTTTPARRTRRTNDGHDYPLFGGPLYLKSGHVSNIYRDISDLDTFYKARKSELSQTFPALIRMSLRLLCEATAEVNKTASIGDFLKANLGDAFAALGNEEKTFIHAQGVLRENVVGLFMSAGHNYTGLANYQQTVAMSMILAKILERLHGKK